MLARCGPRSDADAAAAGPPSLGFTEEQLLEEHLISWFLKDLGGPPLDFRGYVSGAEASEDEAAENGGGDVAQQVAVQMGQGYYSGYLLKKSSRDPCLWRRRWCVLGEDKLWYMKLKHRRTQGRAAAISLVANHVLEHPRNSVRVCPSFDVCACEWSWKRRRRRRRHKVGRAGTSGWLLHCVSSWLTDCLFTDATHIHPHNHRRCSTASRCTRRTASSSSARRTARSSWGGSGPSRRASSWPPRTTSSAWPSS